MKEKWEFDIENLSRYCIGEDKNLYRRPFISKGRAYGYRKISMQHPNRWRINGKWWSKDQLRKHIVPVDSGREIYKTNDLPF